MIPLEIQRCFLTRFINSRFIGTSKHTLLCSPGGCKQRKSNCPVPLRIRSPLSRGKWMKLCQSLNRLTYELYPLSNQRYFEDGNMSRSDLPDALLYSSGETQTELRDLTIRGPPSLGRGQEFVRRPPGLTHVHVDKTHSRKKSQLSIRKALTCREGQSVSVNCSHHAIDNAMRMITRSVTSRYGKALTCRGRPVCLHHATEGFRTRHK